MEERRKSGRVHTCLPAQWQTAAGIHTGTVINGSGGGCFVLAQVEEPGDEPVRLAIKLPGDKDVHLCGEVSFYLPTRGFGLYFTDPSDEDRTMLDTWLDYLETLTDEGDSVTDPSSAKSSVVTTAL